jgi:hypothetical protein
VQLLNSNGVDNESPPRLNGNSNHRQHEEDETLEDPKELAKQQQVGLQNYFSSSVAATP